MRARSDEPETNLEHEMAIGAAGAETFWRFKQLMLRGYKPNYEFSDENAFWFDHPRKAYEHRSVALYPTGVVRSMFAKQETFIDRWDKAGFKGFLKDVPFPTWWERGQEFRQKLFAWIFIIVFYGVMFLVIRFVSDFFKS